MARKSRPAIEINRIDHIVLLVADLERSVRFYTDVLGMHEERRHEDLGLVQMRAGASLVDLQQAKRTRRPGRTWTTSRSISPTSTRRGCSLT